MSNFPQVVEQYRVQIYPHMELPQKITKFSNLFCSVPIKVLAFEALRNLYNIVLCYVPFLILFLWPIAFTQNNL